MSLIVLTVSASAAASLESGRRLVTAAGSQF
jgi:hypothetical protein